MQWRGGSGPAARRGPGRPSASLQTCPRASPLGPHPKTPSCTRETPGRLNLAEHPSFWAPGPYEPPKIGSPEPVRTPPPNGLQARERALQPGWGWLCSGFARPLQPAACPEGPGSRLPAKAFGSARRNRSWRARGLLGASGARTCDLPRSAACQADGAQQLRSRPAGGAVARARPRQRRDQDQREYHRDAARGRTCQALARPGLGEDRAHCWNFWRISFFNGQSLD